MKTFVPKKEEIKRKWYIVDAKGKVPGRIATAIADKLRGKDKPIFTPHMDCGDFVIIINADQVRLTGHKIDQKLYHKHSGFPGGYDNLTARELLEKHPTKLMEFAVSGMLPKNKLRDVFMSKLKVYAGAEHPHEAQQPETLAV